MKRCVIALAVLATYTAAAPAWGHGREQHLMGYVTAVSSDSIRIETIAKETRSVAVTPATRFRRGNQPASLKDVQVGDRIVIHAEEEEGEKLEATEVRFTTPAMPTKLK